MTFLDKHGLIFLEKNLMSLLAFKNLVVKLQVEKNCKIKSRKGKKKINSLVFLMNMESNISFQLQKLFSKMGMLIEELNASRLKSKKLP